MQILLIFTCSCARCLFSSVLRACLAGTDRESGYFRLSGVIVGRDGLASDADQLGALARAVDERVQGLAKSSCRSGASSSGQIQVAVGLTDVAVFEGGKCAVEERLMLEEREAMGNEEDEEDASASGPKSKKAAKKNRTLSSIDVSMNWVRDLSFSSNPSFKDTFDAIQLAPPFVDAAPVNRGGVRRCGAGSVEVTQSRIGLPQGCALPARTGSEKLKTGAAQSKDGAFEPKVISRLSRRYLFSIYFLYLAIY